jgi:hypothetical protein
LEAYFHRDPRLEVWINQILEKIFTVCRLNEVDSEVEFQRGCEIVTKVSYLLQGISIFPAEYLEDGLKQLLEQQLPDSKVINKFPTFQDTMNKMLHEGMTRVNDIGNVINDEFVTERAISALASINSTMLNLEETKVDLHVLELDELATANDSFSVITSSLAPSIPTKPFGILRKTLVPEQAVRLQHVLNTIFPNVSVCWNLNLMGQTFLAQVEDILISLQNPEQTCPVENLKREGWKVYICSSDDLKFPRRLERGIRQILRIGKQCKSGKY